MHQLLLDRQRPDTNDPDDRRGDPSAFRDAMRPGDLVLIRTGSGIGRIVRSLDRTEYNHCAIALGDGHAAHVLPPKSMRGNCVAVESIERMTETLQPERMEVRRPPAALGSQMAAGALALQREGPAFSFNDLLVLATVADTSDRLAEAIAPIGGYLDDQADWEVLLGAHFGVAGPDAITCSELVVRSLPPSVRAELPRCRRHVPASWQEPIQPDDRLAAEVEAIIDQIPDNSTRLHRRRGYAPIIAALDAYAVDTGLDDLRTPHLRVALSVLRHIAADFNARTPLDLSRVTNLLTAGTDLSPGEWRSRLTTPGDLARAAEIFRPTNLAWATPTAN